MTSYEAENLQNGDLKFLTLKWDILRTTWCIGLFHFLSVQGDGRKIPGLVQSMNFQRSTAKSPKIPGGWQHFATKLIKFEIFTLTDFFRQSCCCKQEFQGKKGKKYFLEYKIFSHFS